MNKFSQLLHGDPLHSAKRRACLILLGGLLCLAVMDPAYAIKDNEYFKPAPYQSSAGGYIHNTSQSSAGAWWENVKERTKDILAHLA